MKAIVLYLFFIQLLINSCASFDCGKAVSKDETTSKLDVSVKELAKVRFGDAFVIKENETKEYSLVINNGNIPIETTIKFFIFQMESGVIVYEDVIPDGTVEWSGKYGVKVRVYPGMIKLNNEKNGSGYLYNVRTRIKINN